MNYFFILISFLLNLSIIFPQIILKQSDEEINLYTDLRSIEKLNSIKLIYINN
jgi:hypothetical protein